MGKEDWDLFEHYPNRPGSARGSDTSEAAGESLDESTLSRLRAKVHGFHGMHGFHGATCDEAEVALDLRHETCSARIRELILGGLLVDSGRRRLTRRGRAARVCVLPRYIPI